MDEMIQGGSFSRRGTGVESVFTGPICEFTQRNLSLAATQGKILRLANDVVVAPSRDIGEKHLLASFANAKASCTRDIEVTCVNMSPVLEWLTTATRTQIEALVRHVPLTLPFPRALVGYIEEVGNGVCSAWRLRGLILNRGDDGSSVEVTDTYYDEPGFPRARIYLTESGLIDRWGRHPEVEHDWTMCNLVCATLAMFHVHNIGLHPILLPRHLRKKLKNESGLEGPQVYHTLVLRPFSELGNPASKKSPSGSRPLHLVRGHFAHYTKERPLFGKYAGTFWRPEHEAGDKSIAVVRKTFGFNLDEEAS